MKPVLKTTRDLALAVGALGALAVPAVASAAPAQRSTENPSVTAILRGNLVSVNAQEQRALLRVTSSNRYGRTYVEKIVALRLQSTKVTVADRNGDNVGNFADIGEGNRVLVQARVPARGLAEEVAPRRLVDQSDGVTLASTSEEALAFADMRRDDARRAANARRAAREQSDSRRNPLVAAVLRGTVTAVDVDAAQFVTLVVSSTNNPARSYRGQVVTVRLADVRLQVADSNGDSFVSLADVAAGDRVIVKARIRLRGVAGEISALSFEDRSRPQLQS